MTSEEKKCECAKLPVQCKTGFESHINKLWLSAVTYEFQKYYYNYELLVIHISPEAFGFSLEEVKMYYS